MLTLLSPLLSSKKHFATYKYDHRANFLAAKRPAHGTPAVNGSMPGKGKQMNHRFCVCLFAVGIFTLSLKLEEARGGSYIVKDLGVIGTSATSQPSSRATGINSAGQVVGTSSTASGRSDAFLYTNGSMQDLGTFGGNFSIATGLNDTGHVVGLSYSAAGVGQAFLYNGIATLNLGTMGDSISSANSINSAGQVVGYTALKGRDTSFLYNDGLMQRFIPTGAATFSTAGGINDSGQVAGSDRVNSAPWYHAFRTTITGGIAALSDLGTLGGIESRAVGINSSGQAVGYSSTTGFTANHAFRTTAKGSIDAASDLGTLGGTDSFANGINAAGQAVGYSFTSGNTAQHAFLADVTGPMHDLNVSIPAGSGWVLNSANGINASGQIAGTGTIGGQSHAFLLNPVPEAASQYICPAPDPALWRLGIWNGTTFAPVTPGSIANANQNVHVLVHGWAPESLAIVQKYALDHPGSQMLAWDPNEKITLRMQPPLGLG